MSFFGLALARRAPRIVLASVLLAVACAVPNYAFVPQNPEHCENRLPDTDLGETDIDCGGADCQGCTLGQHCTSSTDCLVGQCIVGYCQEPGCNNRVLDGDETAVDCGGTCPTRCPDEGPCLVASDCLSKVCGGDGLCAMPSCSDGVRNGDELNIDCAGSACDGCGIGASCELDIHCESGLCDEMLHTCALNCARGTAECDNNVSEACETNLLTSPRNCGACGTACELEHAEASCVGGACQIDSCVKPWIRCNTDQNDGCEVNASSDAMNCGGCGMVCPALHGNASCVDSACVIECDDEFGDCDENPLTGCETSTNDVDNCGQCKQKCPATDGEPFCLDGECGATMCDTGEGDCNGDGDCETSLDDDPQNCGRCGNVCSAANGQADCVDGKCVLAGCGNGWQNCDDDATDGGFANGCETNVESDKLNCGDCGQRCDLVANATGSCQSGSCALECNTGFKDCDERLDTGCEADTTSDPDHCGGCENPCNIPHATAACTDSTCVIDDCSGSYEDCTAADGCETDTSDSIQHCGSCAGTCSKSGATDASCTDGACDPPTCDAGHRSCDDNNANGCERDVTTATACGSCNNACGSATPNCVLTNSTYACQAKITISNALPYPTAQAAGNTLTFNATPHAGTHRLILVAIAADSQGNGINGSRPDSVMFGGQAMTPGPSQTGANDTNSPDLFIYYLPLGDSATEGSQVSVTINAATAPAAQVLVMQDLQLNGVRQTNPISAPPGGFLGTSSAEAPDPSVIGIAVPVTASGSLIYSIMSAEWMDGGGCTAGTPGANCPNWSVTPATSLTATETMAMSPVSFGSGSVPIRTFGMVVSATSASLPAAGTYTPSWSIPFSGRMTHLAVAVAPAGAP